MVSLKVGEIREVTIQFESDEIFTIDSANYSIVDNANLEISNGIADVIDKKILTLFQADVIGNFKVKFIANIGNEIYKPTINVVVK